MTRSEVIAETSTDPLVRETRETRRRGRRAAAAPPRMRVALLRGALIGLSVMVLAVAAAAVVVPRVIGAVPLTVLTGSMVPTFSPGDLIITKAVDVDDLDVGDIITFQPESDNPALITHRIVGLSFGSGGLAAVTTQGDANNAADVPIVPGQVMGRYLYRMPALGFVAQFIPTENKGPTMQILGGVLIVGAVGFFVLAAIGKVRKSKRETNG